MISYVLQRKSAPYFMMRVYCRWGFERPVRNITSGNSSLWRDDSFWCHIMLPTCMQTMACRLLGSKLLPESVMAYCQWTTGTFLSEIPIQIFKFIFKKMYLKISPAKCRPFCYDLNMSNDVIWVNIGSGHGLLYDGTRPLPEPLLIYHQWGSVALTGVRPISKDVLKIWIRKSNLNYTLVKLLSQTSRVNELTQCIEVLFPYWLISPWSSQQSAYYCEPSLEDFLLNHLIDSVCALSHK